MTASFLVLLASLVSLAILASAPIAGVARPAEAIDMPLVTPVIWTALRPAARPGAGSTTVFLPLVSKKSLPGQGQPIWPPEAACPGAVALFRKTFVLDRDWPGGALSIVADTRYEVWLDGAWLGRGPARFSRARQESDTYALGSLPAGRHVLAALVQYAPNRRRSESSQAALQAILLGQVGSAWQTLAASDTSWKAIVSPAWDAAAAPVSPLELIGPVEVLDLRRLPDSWNGPAFDDAAWLQARLVTPSPFPALSARTIPMLRDDPRPPVAVVESGLLSPGYRLVEFQSEPGSPGSPGDAGVTLVLTVPLATTLRVEAVDTAPVAVDGGQPLAWVPLADERRPDVAGAEQALAGGRHSLSVTVPAARLGGTACPVGGGRTLAIQADGAVLEAGAGVAAVHDPGRRTLLSNPVPGGDGAPEVQILAGHAEVSIPAGDTPRYVVLDFGRTLYGRLSLVADGPAGTVIDAGWDERLTDGRPLPNPGSLASNLWSQVDSWVLDGTPRSLSTIDARSGRYLLLQVYGPGPVSLHQVRAVEEAYPVEQIGRFASSDPLLDRIWQVGVDTLRPNMTDAYTDTPWRERGQWWADALIAFHANQAAYGDLALFRRGLRQMADAIDANGRPAPMAPNGAGMIMLDYGMQWLEGLHLYWQLSGDLDLVAELYPAAGRLAGFLATYEGPAGLLDVPEGHWSQTALVDWPAISSRSGESTALNAQYGAVLGQLAEMAAALGDGGQAQAYQERSAAVRAAVNRHLFAAAGGDCYAASRLAGELQPCSPHAQAWALRYGAVPPERRAGSTRAMLSGITPFFNDEGGAALEPPGMFYVLGALDEVNGTTAALKLIREQYGDLLARGATTWWEGFSRLQGRFNSLSHAWGSSPTWFLSAHVLGARLTGPNAWRVAPHPGDLMFARGAVPMGSGTLEVDWRRPACGQLELTMAAPPGTSGEIVLPVWRHDAQITLDGSVIWDGGPAGSQAVEMTADGLAIGPVGGGAHEAAAALACVRVMLPAVGRR